MSDNAWKRKYFPRRRKSSADYGLSDEADGNHMTLQPLKSIDKDDDTDFERSATYVGSNQSLSNQIKRAAIYDDEAEIIRILTSIKENKSMLLAENDERGQPCIFYALQSRSQKALVCLLSMGIQRECVVAANGESVLHVVTKMGDIGILRLLLEQHIVVELVDDVEQEDGRAPLHLAAKLNHIEIAKELLQYGAKLQREDFMGKSPIYLAASGGHADMLKVFLEHEKNRVNDLLFNSSCGGGLYKNIFHVAVASGDESTVQVCLEQDPQIVRPYLQQEIRHGDGYIFHAACKSGMEKCLIRIVESVGHLDTLQLNGKDVLGFTPIHKAAMNNHANVVSYIGALSIKFVNETTYDSQTALDLAAQRGHINVVEKLLDLKADFTKRDNSDRTVLHYAIAYPEILKLLLKKKDLTQLLINAKDKDCYTPVHNAALRGLCESVRILLEHGADLNVFTNTFRSPLHCAVSSQCCDVVKLILANEPTLINMADATGKTPLHTAASYGSAEVVKCLLHNRTLIKRDGNDFSPLHIASCKGHLSIIEMLVAFDKSIIDWQNKYGRTALLTAASMCKTDVVKFLLDNKAAITEDYEFFNCLDLSMIKKDKQSAMMMMCHDRWKEIMVSAKHGTEGTMSKLVSIMPEVAHRALCNSLMSVGHPDSTEHCVRYNFMCLQSQSTANRKVHKLKPLTAIKAMLRTNCYRCLCHPVCCKYLKAKWMEFGWKVYSAYLLVYVVFLISLSVYAFGIPSYQKSLENKGKDEASINAKLAMVICIVFASYNSFKEIVQLVVYKSNYFMDKVNFLECVLYVSTFIFAVPKGGKIAVKDSAQWKACSIALFCGWLNLVIYLRRISFDSGIIVFMMRTISVTFSKVMCSLVFSLAAFAAAFTVIMNDREGFERFDVSMLTSATMAMGEFDFKETFLKDEYAEYSTFYWLRMVLLVGFLVVMPIIIMNLLVALAIDDTSNIMQKAKLQKHIQTAKMIVDLERKQSKFCCWGGRKLVPTLEECPNKKHDFSRKIWEFIFHGSDFSLEQTNSSTLNSTTNENLTAILDMMKELQRQNAILHNKVMEIQNEFTLERNHRSRENISSRGPSENIEGSVPVEASAGNKRKVCGGLRKDKRSTGIQPSGVLDINDIVLSAERDIFDDKEREKKENDSELRELKKLHGQMTADEYELR